MLESDPSKIIRSLTYPDTVVASEVKQGVLEHATMTGRQNETISVEPVRVLWVVLHHFVEQYMAHRGTSHRQSRVTRFGFLHRIDRQEPDRIDRFVYQRHVRRGGGYRKKEAAAAAERRGRRASEGGSESGKRRERKGNMEIRRRERRRRTIR